MPGESRYIRDPTPMISSLSHPRLLTLALAILTLAGCSHEPSSTSLPQEQPPAWLQPFGSVVEQWRFRATLEGWFADRGIDVRMTSDGRIVEVKGKGREFDVAEVARACAVLPESQWREALDAQLGTLIDTSEALASWKPPAWEQAKPHLRARIYPDGFVRAAGMRLDAVVRRVDLPGTLTCAVFDDENTALLLPSDVPKTWKQTDEEVLAVAIENTRAALAGHTRLEERDLGEFGKLYEVASDSYYGTLAVLWLDEWPQLLGEHGAFVAIPWRQSVLVLPFDSANAARGVPGLYAVARQVVSEGHGAVAPTVWWRRPDGGFDSIGIEEQDGRPVATPPPSLAKLLREILK